MKTTFIYALNCPTTGGIRYVGKSNNPNKRFKQHFLSRECCHRTNWLKALAVQGLKPVLEILDEVPVEYWQQWEVAYIEFFREQGCDLVNGNAGGEGGHNPTEETRAKQRAHMRGENNHQFGKGGAKNPMFGKKHTAETLIKLRGRKPTFEARERQSAKMKGRKLTPEHRAKLGRSGKRNHNFGKKLSPETRAKISAALTGNIPWNKGKKSI